MTNYQIEIVFPRSIVSSSFEDVLRRWYEESKKSTVIIFDLTYVTWCDLFELTQLALWIRELVNLQKNVLFKTPGSESVKNFLTKYEFGRFLTQHSIVSKLRYVHVNVDSLHSKPYFPIKFHVEESFKELIDYLSEPTTYKTTFADIIESGFVQKAQLRNVIIQELGDNMFHHGKGISANMAIARFGDFRMTDIERDKWKKSLIRGASPFEKAFFTKLNGREYFTIIISDKGPGIFNTLKAAFKEKHPDRVFKEADVLEYAFAEHSTSRSVKDRIGALTEVYDNFNENNAKVDKILPPPTGLYILLNIVREFYGLIYLRSGQSIIAYDFFNNKSAMKSYDINGYKKLANFGGVQIKIHFPLNFKVSEQINQKEKFHFPETTQHVRYAYFKISDYFNEPQKDNYLYEKAAIYRFIQDLNQHQANNAKILSGIILDLTEVKDISLKALYLLVAILMQSQSKDYTHVLINVPPQFVDVLKTAFIPEGETRSRPIILFDALYKREIIGVNKDIEQLFANLFNKSVYEADDHKFIRDNDHIFVAVGKTVSFRHNRHNIFSTGLSTLSQKLKTIITDPSNNIYHPNAKVLIASRVFCEGYVEMKGLMQVPEYKILLKQWLTFLLFDQRPSCVISVGKPCSILLNEVFEERRLLGRPSKILHDNIAELSKWDFTKLYNLGAAYSQSENVLIFCDIVGTGTTLTNILRHFLQNNFLNIYAVINATKSSQRALNVLGRQVPIDSLVELPLHFYDQRPPGWSDAMIVNVNPGNNSLIKKRTGKIPPIWNRKQTFKFIEDKILNNNKIISGHFIHEHTHLTYLLDIPRIIEEHGQEITDVIIDDYLKKDSAEDKKYSTLVVYPSDRPGLKELALSISKATYYAVEMLSKVELQAQYDYEDQDYLGKVIIAIDDAFDSGENILKIIDLCHRKKATKLYVYCLFKRGQDSSVRRLNNLNRYGNMAVEFAYLTEINIPTYKIYNCPICIQNRQLKAIELRLSIEKGLDVVTTYVRNYIVQHSPLNLKNITDEYYSFEKFQISYTSKNIYYRLLLESAKTNLTAREQVVNIIQKANESKDMSDALLLFTIIKNENLFDVINQEVESDKYEFNFKIGIIRACKTCIKSLDTISSDQMDGVLGVLLVVNEDTFIDRMLGLLTRSLGNRDKLLVIIKYLYISKEAINHPQIILNALNDLKDVPEDVFPLILELREKWAGYAKNPPVSERILDYVYQLFECNHEIKRPMNNLKGLHSVREFGPHAFVEWMFLVNTLEKACYHLRELSQFNFLNTAINRSASNLVDRIKGLLDQADQLISFNDNSESRSETMVDYVNRIEYELYTGEYNLKWILDLCATNVYQLINIIFGQNELKVRKPVIEEDIPDFPTIVFGDKDGLQSIIGNIIDNIYEHAQATKILLKIALVDSEVVVNFYDNGKTLHANIHPNVGISKCKENSKRYLGDFELVSLTSDDIYFKQGYVKTAKVVLKHINVLH